MSDEWCTIESDPGVFTSLCEEIGVKGVQFEEIYTLGEEAFQALDTDTIHGLIFLFKFGKHTDERPTVDAEDHGLFFAQQLIHNACATQAILSVLMNQDSLDLGPHLKEFKEFTGCLDPQMRGLAVGNSEPIRKAHNSFRQHSSFEIVNDKDEGGDDAFHFVGYVHHRGKVYELDGLKKGPVLIGEVPAGKPWADTARQEIQRRIEEYSKKTAASGESAEEKVELRFNLMAIINNRIEKAERSMLRERYLRQRANICLVSRGEVDELVDEVDDDDAPDDIPSFEDLSAKEVADVRKIVATCTASIDALAAGVAGERRKREKWAKENSLRRIDLVPLALCAMRHLARRGELMAALEKGKAAHMKRVEDTKAQKAAVAH